jgi:hypothetical protein
LHDPDDLDLHLRVYLSDMPSLGGRHIDPISARVTSPSLLDLTAPRMQRPPVSAMPPPDERRVYGRDEPQQHVDEINPYSILHADLAALFRCRMGGDVNVTEQTEERSPETAARQLSVSQTETEGSQSGT